MEWRDAERELRESRLDDNAGAELWSSDELRSFYNDAVRQACLRARLLVDSTTESVCRLAVEPGTQSVRLHPSILAVRNVTPAVAIGCDELTGCTARRVAKERPRWHLPNDGHGHPRFWIPDWQDGQLWFDRPFQSANTLHLSVWRTPLDTELVEGDADEPVIPEPFHTDLLDWCEWRAYSKKDAETLDNERAGRAYTLFEAKFGRLPSAVEIRLWGVKRHNGVPAQFL